MTARAQIQRYSQSMTPSKRVIGFDQASKTSGYAIIVDGELESYGHFSLSGDVQCRLLGFYNQVSAIIDKVQPTIVGYEDIYYAKGGGTSNSPPVLNFANLSNPYGQTDSETTSNNIVTFKTLSFFFGMMAFITKQKGVPSQSVGATSWKSYCGIKGKKRAEQKANAQLYAMRTYGVSCTEDEADAICIASYLNK